MRGADQFTARGAFGLAAVVADAAQARAALAAAPECRVLLLGPRDGAARLGVGYFKALLDLLRGEHPGRDFVLAVDCGDAAGLALAALRVGIEAILFDVDAARRRRLADIARQCGAALIARPANAVDLTAAPDPFAACRAHRLRQEGGLPKAGPVA